MEKLIIAAVIVLGMMTSQAMAGEFDGALKGVADNKIKTWLHNKTVINAIKAQNTKHAGLSQADIDKLDKQWRAETKGGGSTMIDSVLKNELSAYLKKIKEDSQGLYNEIFVMDDKGLNVGQSDITSDYWQGDEAKWKKTYKAGTDAIHIGDIKQDESTQQFQSQVSLSIVDPDTKSVIGAVTVGVNVDNL